MRRFPKSKTFARRSQKPTQETLSKNTQKKRSQKAKTHKFCRNWEKCKKMQKRTCALPLLCESFCIFHFKVMKTEGGKGKNCQESTHKFVGFMEIAKKIAGVESNSPHSVQHHHG